MANNQELGMFFSQLSVIDGAFIDHKGWIIGESYNPAVRLYGALTAGERVIADFSSCKKHLKEIFDHRDNGLDHKLWIGHESNVVVENVGACSPSGDKYEAVQVLTPHISMQVPMDGIRRVRANAFSPEAQNVADWLASYVLGELRHRGEYKGAYEDLDRVEFSRMISPELPYETKRKPTEFKYTHGLARSTSWGCNLIAHGHRSYIQLRGLNGTTSPELEALEQKMADYLDNKYLANQEHITMLGSKTLIRYTSAMRGVMTLDLLSEYANSQLVILDDEPTIENIASFLAETFAKDLEDAAVVGMYVSEGSNKGAFVHIYTPSKI